MAYDVDNIIKVNLNLSPLGIGTANFNTVFFFAPEADLESVSSLAAGDFKDYESAEEVLDDFADTTAAYLAATRWFSNPVKPETFTVWVWDKVNDDVATVLAAAEDSPEWRFWYAFPKDVTDVDADATSIAEHCESNSHGFGFVRSDSALLDQNDDTTLADDFKSAGYRFSFIGFRESETLSSNPSNAYATLQTASVFQKFNFEGQNTSITAEYQVLPGIVGESLQSSSYQSLKDKNVMFWSEVELKGQTDTSRVINSRTFSSFTEFLDDVYNLEVLKNEVQVASYNYIANAGSKRGLTPRGYAGLLSTVEDVLHQGYINGTLGRSTYTDQNTGEEREARYGYVLLSEPEDALTLTDSQKLDREYPPVQALVILARAGHQAEITLNIE